MFEYANDFILLASFLLCIFFSLTTSFLQSCVYFESSILLNIYSYRDNYASLNDVGLFICNREITQRHNSCTIEILDTGTRGTITLGIGPEDYKVNRQPGWDSNSIALHGDNGQWVAMALKTVSYCIIYILFYYSNC